MNDDLVKRLRNTPNWMREEYGHYKDGLKVYDRAPFEAADAIEAQAARIAELEAALATARREGMKDAAKWHEARSMELSGKAGVARNFRQLLRQSDFHMESATAIRAAAGEGK
jgi:hypothetical protein